MSKEDAPASLPELQSVKKAMSLPIVSAAVGEFKSFFRSPTDWMFSYVKRTATFLAIENVVPYVKKPIEAADAAAVAALEALEQRVPLVKEQPQVIAETAKAKLPELRAAAEPYIQSMKDKSSETGSTLLGYGYKTAEGIGLGASYARQRLGQYMAGHQPEPTGEARAEGVQAAAPGGLWAWLFGK